MQAAAAHAAAASEGKSAALAGASLLVLFSPLEPLSQPEARHHVSVRRPQPDQGPAGAGGDLGDQAPSQHLPPKLFSSAAAAKGLGAA